MKERVELLFRCVTYAILLGLILSALQSDKVYAKGYDFPKEVKVVKNEQAMIKQLIVGMRKHKKRFSFYYPGITKDYKKYQSQFSYGSFMEKITRKDGYIAGIVSGFCMTIQGIKKKYVTFQFGYLTTKWQEKRMNKMVKRIAKRIGTGGRAERARKAHDYLIAHIQYDANFYNPYYAFFKGKGMCMSYALAYQRLLQEMKIPCVYIKGRNHAWNMVKIGAYWYNVDVTWDDRRNGQYRYFLKTDSEFPGHKRPKSKYLSSLRKAVHSYNLSVIR